MGKVNERLSSMVEPNLNELKGYGNGREWYEFVSDPMRVHLAKLKKMDEDNFKRHDQFTGK